jgi:hypothetical protein
MYDMSVYACLSPLDTKFIYLHLRIREFSGGHQHHALNSMLNGGTVSNVDLTMVQSQDTNGRPKPVYGSISRDSARPNQQPHNVTSVKNVLTNLTRQEALDPTLFSGSCVASVILHIFIITS